MDGKRGGGKFDDFFSRIDYGKGSNPPSPPPLFTLCYLRSKLEIVKKEMGREKKLKVKKCFLPWLLLSSLFRRFPLSPHSQQKKVRYNILPNIEEKLFLLSSPRGTVRVLRPQGGIQVCTNWGGVATRGGEKSLTPTPR